MAQKAVIYLSVEVGLLGIKKKKNLTLLLVRRGSTAGQVNQNSSFRPSHCGATEQPQFNPSPVQPQPLHSCFLTSDPTSPQPPC